MALWKEGEQGSVPEERETCIGKGCELEGKVVVHGNLRIDGKVKGQIQVDGQLIVGPGAQVAADIVADVLRVEGEVTGDLRGASLIALAPSARVKGSVHSPALAIDRGAVFEGSCTMQPDRSNVVPVPQPAPKPVIRSA